MDGIVIRDGKSPVDGDYHVDNDHYRNSSYPLRVSQKTNKKVTILFFAGVDITVIYIKNISLKF